MKNRLFLAGFTMALLIGACSTEPQSDPVLAISAVSNQPHLISGGDVLIAVAGNLAAEQLRLQVNGADAGAEFKPVAGVAGSYQALVSGLPIGESTVVVSGGGIEADLALTNYPSSGPIFSGEHQQPYLCLAELAPDADGGKRRFAIGNGEFLDHNVQDENCHLPTRVDYLYQNGNAEFLPLADPAALPADVAYTTTSEGVDAPYIVRLETGTINRAVYQIAILHDPRSGQPSAHATSPQWNGRLVYTYGGGCEAGFFQGTSTGGVLRDNMLALGYAIVSSTLNVNAQGGCNDVISAETTMMVKEHFIESYGAPRYTIGSGGSGGAMQQLLIAGAYPGLLDGLLPSLTFADAVSYSTDAQECASLLRDFANDPARGLDEETRSLIGGWSMWSVCDESLGRRPKRVGPDDCPAAIPPELAYHPRDNPDGIRCSIYDSMRNIFGERLYAEISAGREFARSPHDNVGVQYGLAALNDGLIDKELFLDLNENIGGWDIDVYSRPRRTEADPEAVRAAYETGRITSGGAGLAEVPIIDDRAYLDFIGNFHASVYSPILRARLLRDNGHAENLVTRRHFRELRLADENLALMDQWLANIRADGSDLPPAEKIVRTRPADLRNDCIAENGERIIDQPVFDMDRLFDNTGSPCNALFPPHAGLRLIAGGPLTNDILKCQLKEIDYTDYAVGIYRAGTGAAGSHLSPGRM